MMICADNFFFLFVAGVCAREKEKEKKRKGRRERRGIGCVAEIEPHRRQVAAPQMDTSLSKQPFSTFSFNPVPRFVAH